MSNLRELYQQLILDHNKIPEIFARSIPRTAMPKATTPCVAIGCRSISKLRATALQKSAFKGRDARFPKHRRLDDRSRSRQNPRRTEAYFKDFQAMLTDPTSEPDLNHIGKLSVFASVRDYPTRVKCATLSWHALRASHRKCPHTRNHRKR